MFLGCGDHSHCPFPAFLGTALEAAVISGLSTPKRWWEQWAVSRERQEHPKASRAMVGPCRVPGSASARGSRERWSRAAPALVSKWLLSEMLQGLSPQHPGVDGR